jgi:HAD superfamily hydrolase (TIGR01549 family)
MSKIKGIIFDLYGTLAFINKRTETFKKLIEMLTGNDPKSITALKKIILTNELKIADLVALVNPRMEIDIDKFETETKDEVNSTKVYPDTCSLLQTIRDRHYKIGLISNLDIYFKAPFFDLGLSTLVDSYVFSCEVGMKKPDRKIYEIALNQLGLAPNEALMVGDSIQSDYYGPKAMGINAILLNRSNELLSPVIKSINSLEVLCELL